MLDFITHYIGIAGWSCIAITAVWLLSLPTFDREDRLRDVIARSERETRKSPHSEK